MPSVLHFRRHLFGPPDAVEVSGICVRNVVVPGDVSAWLALRERAMADQRPRIRTWSAADFETEMLRKSWWSAERSWIAVAGDVPSPDVMRDDGTSGDHRSPAIGANGLGDPACVVGAVTLALREGSSGTVPVVHWLLVDPGSRRRGVGRLLMSHLELAAWNDGWREIELETHAGWTTAVAFYHSIGYAPVRDRSPR